MCATSRICRQLKIIHNVEVKFQNLLIGENKEVKSKVRIAENRNNTQC
jgi:hypothetical protein